MGKSFANFMCKKFFHPASFANIKRVWMAEERSKTEQAKQDNLRSEYEREQEIYNNRMTMGDEKVKHGLHFMYEPPKGLEMGDKADGEQEYKFEWQREAPREDFAKNMDVQDQPLGIEVRDVKCIKCHDWGHVNTDRECPMYDQSTDVELAGPSSNPAELMDEMRRDGYAFKQSVLGRKNNTTAVNQQMVGNDSDDNVDPETSFVKSLTKKQKKKLLKKLERLQQGETSGDRHKKSKKQKKEIRKRQKRRHSSSSDVSSSDSDSEDERQRQTKHKNKQRHQSPDSSSDEQERKKRRHGDSGYEMECKKSRRGDDNGSDSENKYHYRDVKEKKDHQGKHRRGDRYTENGNCRDRHVSGSDRERQADRNGGEYCRVTDRHGSRHGTYSHNSSGHERVKHQGKDSARRDHGLDDVRDRRREEVRGKDDGDSRKSNHSTSSIHKKDNSWVSLSDKFDGFGSNERSDKRRRNSDDKAHHRHERDSSCESEEDGHRHGRTERREDRRSESHRGVESTREDKRERYSENKMRSSQNDKYYERKEEKYR